MAPEAHSHTNGATNGTANGVPQKKREKDLSQVALRLIEEKLPTMSALNAVLQLDIGLPAGPIFVDLRDEPKILKEYDGEPNCKVKIKPLYIKRFTEGAMEPRYGLFKDGMSP